jgi:N-methylhydantoinase A
MRLDLDRAQECVQALARRLSLPLEAAAWGVIRVANANMERAIRTISVERGYDPRRFTLVAFGGAGPLHTCELAASLHIPSVLIPLHPGVLSALGMILADVVKDYSQTVMLDAAQGGSETLARLFAPMYDRALTDLLAEGLDSDQIVLLPALDMRYTGQSYELTVGMEHGEWSNPLQQVERFHAAHRSRFSYANENEAVEIVNLRVKAVGQTAKPRFSPSELGDLNPRAAHIGYKQVYFSEPRLPRAARPMLTALYDREALSPGNIVVGPAVVFQLDTTTIIPPGWAAMVDAWRNLVVERRGA